MKKFFENFVAELLANGIGWIAGLLAADIVSLFFVAKSWKNIWGVFSFKREAVSQDAYGLLEWIIAAVIGYIVLVLVNNYVGEPLMRKFRNRDND